MCACSEPSVTAQPCQQLPSPTPQHHTMKETCLHPYSRLLTYSSLESFPVLCLPQWTKEVTKEDGKFKLFFARLDK